MEENEVGEKMIERIYTKALLCPQKRDGAVKYRALYSTVFASKSEQHFSNGKLKLGLARVI